MPKMIAEPEPIEIDPARSAVIVVDMQNAFVSKGGLFEARGFDVVSIQKVSEPIRRICDKAREKKVKVIGHDTQANDHPLATAIGPQRNGPLHPHLAEEYKKWSGGRDWKDDFPEWEPVHRILFKNGILGIENVGGDLDKVASLPTREQALSMLLGVLKAPIAKLAGTLAAPAAKLARTVAAVRDQKQAAGA